MNVIRLERKITTINREEMVQAKAENMDENVKRREC